MLIFLKCEAAFLNFDIVNVMEQPNTYDCGVFALANATELAYDQHCAAGTAAT